MMRAVWKEIAQTVSLLLDFWGESPVRGGFWSPVPKKQYNRQAVLKLGEELY